MTETSPGHRVVPAPVHLETGGPPFTLTPDTRIVVSAGDEDAAPVGALLADTLRRASGLPVALADTADPADTIVLERRADAAGLGAEGYELTVTAERVLLRAAQPAGLCRGTQTLRQLLPPEVDGSRPARVRWQVPGVRVVDRPRYPWRGAALDVARHFFGVADVLRYVDLLALYKFNRLHLHLTDDQGWRIEITSWPRLATHGGQTQVGGGPGGYYTQRQYAEIVAYAAARHITVVPEVDLPGHVHAALVAYPELAPDGYPTPRPYTGIEVGFSALAATAPATYRFMDDVLGEVAALTPGPYLHVGGDEVRTLAPADYRALVGHAQRVVREAGRTPVCWQEAAGGIVLPGSLLQYWTPHADPAPLLAAARAGAGVIMSPAARTYLDMRYDETTELGLTWAGTVEVRDAYDWDPATVLSGLPPEQVLGVEAQLWSETLRDVGDMEVMALPRLAALAEVGWSGADRLRWPDFRARLAAQAPRWTVMGARFWPSPQIRWPEQRSSQ